MNHREELNVDEGLRGNEQIEEAIVALQQKPSQEMLAHTLDSHTQTHERKRTGHHSRGASGGETGDCRYRQSGQRTERTGG